MIYRGILMLWICLLLCLPGCTSKRSPRSVVYRLKWLYNVSAAGDIWAQESGIFSSHGLRVEIREGGPEQDAIKDLELGRAQFGVASADQVIRAAAKGAQVVVLAQIFQINPLQWIYIKNKGLVIKGPQDLKGLCVGVTYGGNDEAILMSLLKMYRIGPDDLRLYAVHYDFNPFWRGEVDLWPVYRNIEGIILQEKIKKSGRVGKISLENNVHSDRFIGF
jgi:NitT/TauT family transport system substrate-binding protein